MHITFDNLKNTFHRIPHVELLIAMSRGMSASLVGGAVRDALSGLPVTDVDLVFPDDPTSLAKRFARKIGGHWFWLDEERLQSRVVLNSDDHCPDFDFAPYRAPSLGQDLLDRDFTINAMALPLAKDWTRESLLDPLCGLEDLSDDVLRMASNGAFADDPLRILKGIRHATVLELTVEGETLRSMRQHVTGLYRIAVERVRHEIWKLLASDNARYGLDLLDESMAGNYLFGNGYSEACESLKETFSLCKEQWGKLVNEQPVVNGWLSEEIEQGLSYGTLLLWTRILAQLKSALPYKLADEWMLSRKAKMSIKSLSADDNILLTEYSRLGQTGRSFCLWSRKRRIDPRLLLLSVLLAKGEATSELCDDIVKWVPVVDALSSEEPEPFVDGHWLRSELGLQEGPEMKKALELLMAAEICGEISNKDEAHHYLLEHYKNID